MEYVQDDFSPKWYLNGFPKSGLHWLSLMMMPIAQPLFDDHRLWNVPWSGTFRYNGWANIRVPIEIVTYKIGRLKDKSFMKGHAAYDPILDSFLWCLGASVIFIYRDLRDVAVSQAFHVISEDDEKMMHPDKDLYRSMDSFDDVLLAVIKGVTGKDGVRYPGVIERWENYAGWLECDWICKIRFEDLANDPHGTAIKILRHGMERASTIFGLSPEFNTEGLELAASWMVDAGNMKDKSPTFRKGVTGEWKEYFTDDITMAFAMSDTFNWINRLGYDEEEWWEK